MINYYDSIYDKAMTQSVTADTEKKRAVASVLKVFHETVRTARGADARLADPRGNGRGPIAAMPPKKNPKKITILRLLLLACL